MNDVVLSRGIRGNLLNLQRTAEMTAQTQNRLATGKKVNSALDNPTNFFTAAALQSRASDLTNMLDAVSNGIKTIELADIGLKGLTRLMEQMQSAVRQARQDRTFRATSYTVDPAMIGTTTAKNLTFSGGTVGSSPVNVALNVAAVGGSRTFTEQGTNYVAPTPPAPATLSAQAAYVTPLATQNFTMTFGGTSVNIGLTTAETTVADAVAAINTQIGAQGAGAVMQAFTTGDGVLRFRTLQSVDGNLSASGPDSVAVLGGAPVTTAGSDGQYQMTIAGRAVTIPTGATLAQAISTINTALSGSGFTAMPNGGNNRIRIEANDPGTTPLTIAGPDLAIMGTPTTGTAPITPGSTRTVEQLVDDINNNASLAGKVRASSENGRLRIENLSTEALSIVGATATGITGGTGSGNTSSILGNDVRRQLEIQFNELRNQFDRLSDDSTYNGINLLRGDELKVVFNETATSVLSVRARDSQGNPRAINTTTLSVTTVMAGEFSTEAALDQRLDQLGVALAELRAQSSAFGTNMSTVTMREAFTKSMISTLKIGADGLTLADQNEEAANLLALQTRQQLSQTALSLANQADQGVLRLFG